MDVKTFDRLGKRDFENGATLDEIRQTLKRVEESEFKVHQLSDPGCNCDKCIKEGFRMLRAMG